MFCALNGATLTPSLASHRQIPATSTLLPASDEVPMISSAPTTTRVGERPGTVLAAPGDPSQARDLAGTRPPRPPFSMPMNPAIRRRSDAASRLCAA